MSQSLATGNKVKLRNGEVGIVADAGHSIIILLKNSFIEYDKHYTECKHHINSDYDIVNVYKKKSDQPHRCFYELCENDILAV